MRKIGLIIFAALLLAGCGDGEQQVRATLTADRKAGERQDWAAMCALRTEAARRELLFCTPPENESIATFLVGTDRDTDIDIDVDDAQATARYDDGSITRLRKVDGRWLID